MKKIIIVTALAFSGCMPEADNTDYNKPYDGTQRRNEQFRKLSIESIKQDRANERAYQAGK